MISWAFLSHASCLILCLWIPGLLKWETWPPKIHRFSNLLRLFQENIDLFLRTPGDFWQFWALLFDYSVPFGDDFVALQVRTSLSLRWNYCLRSGFLEELLSIEEFTKSPSSPKSLTRRTTNPKSNKTHCALPSIEV